MMAPPAGESHFTSLANPLMLPLKSIFHSPTSIVSSAAAPWDASRSANALVDATSLLSTFMVSSPCCSNEGVRCVAPHFACRDRNGYPLAVNVRSDTCGSALAKVTLHYASPTSASQ